MTPQCSNNACHESGRPTHQVVVHQCGVDERNHLICQILEVVDNHDTHGYEKIVVDLVVALYTEIHRDGNLVVLYVVCELRNLIYQVLEIEGNAVFGSLACEGVSGTPVIGLPPQFPFYLPH